MHTAWKHSSCIAAAGDAETLGRCLHTEMSDSATVAISAAKMAFICFCVYRRLTLRCLQHRQTCWSFKGWDKRAFLQILVTVSSNLTDQQTEILILHMGLTQEEYWGFANMWPITSLDSWWQWEQSHRPRDYLATTGTEGKCCWSPSNRPTHWSVTSWQPPVPRERHVFIDWSAAHSCCPSVNESDRRVHKCCSAALGAVLNLCNINLKRRQFAFKVKVAPLGTCCWSA